MPRHVPIMPGEVLELLNPQPGEAIFDCTLGAGGHSKLLALAVGPTGRVIAVDQDPAMIELAKAQFADLPITAIHASFDQLRDVLDSLHIAQVDAVFADLGICSDQLDDPVRGFTFQSDGPLDMRLDPTRGVPASRLVATLSERELADLIYQFGEERYSRRIARRIVETRHTQSLATTQQLAQLVRQCVPRGRERIDPATRTFQALRIAVNEELTALDQLLRVLPQCVRLGGRAAIMSFHSLEDRRVKQAFRGEQWEPLTKKPRIASEYEMQANPRSRSAKLRAAVRVDDAGGKR